jgi:hypothetical protein
MAAPWYGECVITQLCDPVHGTQFRIDHADPVIRISPQFLASIPPADSGWPATFDGNVLRINGVNRQVVYRIREILEPVPGTAGMWDYIGEFPD